MITNPNGVFAVFESRPIMSHTLQVCLATEAVCPGPVFPSDFDLIQTTSTKL